MHRTLRNFNKTKISNTELSRASIWNRGVSRHRSLFDKEAPIQPFPALLYVSADTEERHGGDMDPLHYQPQVYVIHTCKGDSGLLLWAFSEGPPPLMRKIMSRHHLYITEPQVENAMRSAGRSGERVINTH